MPDHPAVPPTRWAGNTLLAGTALALVFVAHHPVLGAHAGPEDPRAVLQTIAGLRGMDHLVHGGLIVLLLAFAVCLVEFARRIDPDRAFGRVGLLVYGAGIAATIGAATLDGFVIPDIARHFVGAPAEDVRVGYGLLVFAGLAIQNLTKLGFILMSGGILAWSCGLLGIGGRASAAGVVGLLAGVAPAAVLLGSGLVLRPPVLLGLLAAYGAWNVAAAWLLIGGAPWTAGRSVTNLPKLGAAD